MRTSKLLKIISVTVCIIFTWNQIVAAGDVYRIQIPEEIGTVTARYKGGNDETVVIVQDAHTSAEAQKNISDIISYVTTEYEIDLINIEGAADKVDVGFYRHYPNKKVLQNVSCQMLNKGIITGSEHAAINSEVELNVHGVENRKEYLRNLSACTKVLEKKDAFVQAINEVCVLLEKAKSRYYQKKLFDFDTVLSEYHNGGLSLVDFLQSLFALCGEIHFTIDPETYVYTTYFCEMANAGEDDVAKAHMIDYGALMEEVEELSFTIEKKLAQSDHEQELITLSRHMHILSRMVQLRALPADIVYFHNEKDSLTSAYLLNAFASIGIEQPDVIDSLDELIAQIDSFYAIADGRSAILIDNTIQNMKMSKEENALLVTGGFHTKEIESLLQEKDMSYVVVNPTVTSLNETIPYDALMMGTRSFYETLLESACSTLQRVIVSAPLTDKIITLITEAKFMVAAQVAELDERIKNLTSHKEFTAVVNAVRDDLTDAGYDLSRINVEHVVIDAIKQYAVSLNDTIVEMSTDDLFEVSPPKHDAAIRENIFKNLKIEDLDGKIAASIQDLSTETLTSLNEVIRDANDRVSERISETDPKGIKDSLTDTQMGKGEEGSSVITIMATLAAILSLIPVLVTGTWGSPVLISSLFFTIAIVSSEINIKKAFSVFLSSGIIFLSIPQAFLGTVSIPYRLVVAAIFAESLFVSCGWKPLNSTSYQPPYDFLEQTNFPSIDTDLYGYETVFQLSDGCERTLRFDYGHVGNDSTVFIDNADGDVLIEAIIAGRVTGSVVLYYINDIPYAFFPTHADGQGGENHTLKYYLFNLSTGEYATNTAFVPSGDNWNPVRKIERDNGSVITINPTHSVFIKKANGDSIEVIVEGSIYTSAAFMANEKDLVIVGIDRSELIIYVINTETGKTFEYDYSGEQDDEEYPEVVQELSGPITEDTTLGIEGGQITYTITDDVIVENGVTLTILPGVTLTFAAGKKLIVGSQQGVQAAPVQSTQSRAMVSSVSEPSRSQGTQLIIQGTQSNPVVLTGENGALWGGIESAWSNVELHHVTITQAQCALTALYSKGTNHFQLFNCDLHNNKEVFRGGAKLTIKDSAIHDNESLINIQGGYENTAALVLEGNTMRNNGTYEGQVYSVYGWSDSRTPLPITLKNNHIENSGEFQFLGLHHYVIAEGNVFIRGENQNFALHAASYECKNNEFNGWRNSLVTIDDSGSTHRYTKILEGNTYKVDGVICPDGDIQVLDTRNSSVSIQEGDYKYVVTKDYEFIAVDLKRGKIIYRTPVEASPGPYAPSLELQNGTIIYHYSVWLPDQTGEQREQEISLASTELSGSITEDTTLQTGVTYTVTDDLTVESGITLTIPEGVRLTFVEGKKLIVNGNISVQGTEEQPVAFTASDTSKKWGGIILVNGELSMQHASLSYADRLFFSEYGNGNNIITLAHCHIHHNNDLMKLYIRTLLRVSDSIIEDNQGVIALSAPAYERSVEFSGCMFLNNPGIADEYSYSGLMYFIIINYSGIRARFINNTFTACGAVHAIDPATYLTFEGNTFHRAAEQQYALYAAQYYVHHNRFIGWKNSLVAIKLYQYGWISTGGAQVGVSDNSYQIGNVVYDNGDIPLFYFEDEGYINMSHYTETSDGYIIALTSDYKIIVYDLLKDAIIFSQQVEESDINITDNKWPHYSIDSTDRITYTYYRNGEELTTTIQIPYHDTLSGEITSYHQLIEGRHYKLEGELIIRAGGTLYIPATTWIEAAEGATITVEGTLETAYYPYPWASRTVFFTGIDGAEWGGIRNLNGMVNLNDCVIEGATVAFTDHYEGTVQLKNVELRNNTLIYQGKGTLSIDNSDIHHNASGFTINSSGTLNLISNDIYDNNSAVPFIKGTSLFRQGKTTLFVEDNLYRNSGMIEWLGDDIDVEIGANTFGRALAQGVILSVEKTNGQIIIEDNVFWGWANEAEALTSESADSVTNNTYPQVTLTYTDYEFSVDIPTNSVVMKNVQTGTVETLYEFSYSEPSHKDVSYTLSFFQGKLKLKRVRSNVPYGAYTKDDVDIISIDVPIDIPDDLLTLNNDYVITYTDRVSDQWGGDAVVEISDHQGNLLGKVHFYHERYYGMCARIEDGLLKLEYPHWGWSHQVGTVYGGYTISFDIEEIVAMNSTTLNEDISITYGDHLFLYDPDYHKLMMVNTITDERIILVDYKWNYTSKNVAAAEAYDLYIMNGGLNVIHYHDGRRWTEWISIKLIDSGDFVYEYNDYSLYYRNDKLIIYDSDGNLVRSLAISHERFDSLRFQVVDDILHIINYTSDVTIQYNFDDVVSGVDPLNNLLSRLQYGGYLFEYDSVSCELSRIHIESGTREVVGKYRYYRNSGDLVYYLSIEDNALCIKYYYDGVRTHTIVYENIDALVEEVYPPEAITVLDIDDDGVSFRGYRFEYNASDDTVIQIDLENGTQTVITENIMSDLPEGTRFESIYIADGELVFRYWYADSSGMRGIILAENIYTLLDDYEPDGDSAVGNILTDLITLTGNEYSAIPAQDSMSPYTDTDTYRIDSFPSLINGSVLIQTPFEDRFTRQQGPPQGAHPVAQFVAATDATVYVAFDRNTNTGLYSYPETLFYPGFLPTWLESYEDTGEIVSIVAGDGTVSELALFKKDVNIGEIVELGQTQISRIGGNRQLKYVAYFVFVQNREGGVAMLEAEESDESIVADAHEMVALSSHKQIDENIDQTRGQKTTVSMVHADGKVITIPGLEFAGIAALMKARQKKKEKSKEDEMIEGKLVLMASLDVLFKSEMIREDEKGNLSIDLNGGDLKTYVEVINAEFEAIEQKTPDGLYRIIHAGSRNIMKVKKLLKKIGLKRFMVINDELNDVDTILKRLNIQREDLMLYDTDEESQRRYRGLRFGYLTEYYDQAGNHTPSARYFSRAGITVAQGDPDYVIGGLGILLTHLLDGILTQTQNGIKPDIALDETMRELLSGAVGRHKLLRLVTSAA
ncbi:MAG: hypothetical protein KKH94_04305 [Candidatus Omnitrophica bacterium]|nr:hypothetical protein [Candidatus Omnitrophota bacterium]